jgi:hypothetical protein
MKRESKLSDDGSIIPGMPKPETLGDALTQLTNNPATPGKHAAWLANELGFVNGGIVSHWKSGRHKPRPEVLEKVAKIYNVPYAKLAVLPVKMPAPAQPAMKWMDIGGKTLRVNERTGETHILVDAEGSPQWKLVKE